MFNKKSLSIAVSSIALMSIMMWMGNFASGQETHKTSDKLTASEHEYEHIDHPKCPMCKSERLSPEKGRTLSKMAMVCPDCKNEVSEMAVHHCDQCGKDVLICTMCKKATSDLKVETPEAKCPKCNETRSRPIKGTTYAKWEMKCPDCKKDSKEWHIQHCEKCGIDFLSCPICEKQEKPK